MIVLGDRALSPTTLRNLPPRATYVYCKMSTPGSSRFFECELCTVVVPAGPNQIISTFKGDVLFRYILLVV